MISDTMILKVERRSGQIITGEMPSYHQKLFKIQPLGPLGLAGAVSYWGAIGLVIPEPAAFEVWLRYQAEHTTATSLTEFAAELPTRSIYSYTHLQSVSGKEPNFFDIAFVDIGGAKWRIWLGFGNTRTTAQRFNTSETGNLMYPDIFVDEWRGDQKRSLGYISFDYNLVPTVGIYSLLPETRDRVLALTDGNKFTGYPLLEKYVLELIKDTQTQSALLAANAVP